MGEVRNQRILVLTRYTRAGASSRIRFLQFLPALAAQGFVFDVTPFFDEQYIAGLYGPGVSFRSIIASYWRRIRTLLWCRGYDLIWVEKEALPWAPEWVETLMIGKTPYVADFDDAWFHRYDMNRSGVVRALLGRKIDSLMRRARVVIAGNEYLADRARKAGAEHVVIVPSAVDLGRYPPRPHLVPVDRPPGAAIVIGWIGTPITAAYLGLIEPVLRALAREVRIEIRVIGAPIPPSLRGLPATSRAWSEDSEVSEVLDVDIGIMPLEDTPWEQGKCAYKLLQIMAAGRPVVGSRVGANRVVVENGVNGLLAANMDEWLKALRALASDAEMRRRLGLAARQTIEAAYSTAQAMPGLAEALNVATTRRLGTIATLDGSRDKSVAS